MIVTVGADGLGNVYVTVMVSVPGLFSASHAVIVMLFVPLVSAILLHDHDVVPVHVPLPPVVVFDHATAVTPILSDAVPASVIGVLVVL